MGASYSCAAINGTPSNDPRSTVRAPAMGNHEAFTFVSRLSLRASDVRAGARMAIRLPS